MVSIGTLMSTLEGGMVNVSYPALVEAFDSDTSTVLWVTVANWVTSVGLLLTLGWLGDVAGRKRVFTLGFVVFALGLLLSAASLNIWQLIGARIFQGVGSSMLLSNLNALIAASFPEGERGKALGISGAVVGVGLSAGPLLGGALLDLLDWRALFYTRAPLGVLGAVLGWWLLPMDRPQGKRPRVDLIGATSLVGTLACFLLFVNQGGRGGFGSLLAVWMALAAGLFLAVLVWSERRSVRPILGTTLFRTRRYTASLLVLGAHYLSHGGIMLLAPFFLIDALGYSATKMGLFVAAFYVGGTFVAPSAGRLSDAVGPRPFLILGNILLAAALLWLSRLGIGTSEVSLLAAMLVAGAGSGFFEPVVTSAIMGSVPGDRLGTASASIAMGRHIAFSVGVAVAGAVFAIRERVHLVTPDLSDTALEAGAVAGGFGDTLLVSFVMAAVAVALALRVRGQGAGHGGDERTESVGAASP